mmetsp:Transcript_29711/g.45565  ORF Transcript_29711/g.45565 Transcript_29711/m.45565 type:complete len:210 (-) Transcript_29711:170-799(-)
MNATWRNGQEEVDKCTKQELEPGVLWSLHRNVHAMVATTGNSLHHRTLQTLSSNHNMATAVTSHSAPETITTVHLGNNNTNRMVVISNKATIIDPHIKINHRAMGISSNSSREGNKISGNHRHLTMGISSSNNTDRRISNNTVVAIAMVQLLLHHRHLVNTTTSSNSNSSVRGIHSDLTTRVPPVLVASTNNGTTNSRTTTVKIHHNLE